MTPVIFVSIICAFILFSFLIVTSYFFIELYTKLKIYNKKMNISTYIHLLKKAKQNSINLRWNIFKNNLSNSNYIKPESCHLCTLSSLFNNNITFPSCNYCPINDKEYICCKEYNYWTYHKSEITAIDSVINKINSINEKEWAEYLASIGILKSEISIKIKLYFNILREYLKN